MIECGNQVTKRYFQHGGGVIYGDCPEIVSQIVPSETEENTSALVPQIWTGDEFDGAKRNQALLSLSLFLHWPLSQPLFHRRRSLTQTPFTCKFRRVTRPRSYSPFGGGPKNQLRFDGLSMRVF